MEREFLLKGDTTITFSTPSMKFKKWKFEAIEFKENSAEITDPMKPDLDKLIMFLSDHPNLGLKISGHTDSRGNPDDNLRLSQARADAIKEYLVREGRFQDTRIEATGYGSSRPIVANEVSEEDRRINRRVEFEIVRME
ncbi:MAG: OmpA family protein [Bacteroidia bacterium]|nr:OmpA family protein [Bacteroidia bacterium]